MSGFISGFAEAARNPQPDSAAINNASARQARTARITCRRLPRADGDREDSGWFPRDPALWTFVAAMVLFHMANAPGGVYLGLFMERDLGAPRPGMIVLADKGLAGKHIERFAADITEVLLARPDRKDEKKRRFGNLAGMRQRIESIYDMLKDQLNLEDHRARTPAGVFARVAQRLLALAAVIWHNWTINAPVKRSLIAYDH